LDWIEVKFEVTAVIQLSIKDTAEAVSTTLNRLGWRIKMCNEKLRQASAHQQWKKTSVQDVWRCEFDAVISWRPVTNDVEVSVTVTESEMQWTRAECVKRCEQIIEGLKNDAAVLSETSGHQSDTYGSARWASDEELQQASYMANGNSSNKFILGLTGTSIISVPAAETAMHALVCGPTGCGKSSTVYIPNLVERIGVSAIVTEATAGSEQPDLFRKTAGYRKQSGHQVYKFNPDDLTSHRINPLENIQTVSQVVQTANLIIKNTSMKHSYGDQIWETSERQLLKVLIMHAVAENKHLGHIRQWLREGAEGLKTILLASKISEARKEYSGFYNASSEGFRNGVISGLMQRLNLWTDPKIVALTETADIDFKTFSEELFTFYLAVPGHKEELKPLAALVFNFILNLALEKQFKHPLALFLDEFTNYGHIPAIAEKLTIIRHRDIPATLGFQDYMQLRKVYEEVDAGLLFSQPGTRIFFRPREVNTAKKISEALGTRTVVERKVTSSGQIVEREIPRPLMNAGEVMALEKGKAIAFTPSTSPILLTNFKWQQYAYAAEIEPPTFRKLVVDDRLVKDCEQAKTKPDWEIEWEEKRKQQQDELPNF
jgi:type IV secretion system protein VirD4